VGILGYPVGHTLSPQMHNAAFAHLGLDYIYLPFEVRPAGLERAVRGLAGLNIIGVNVTVPHKERVIDYLDDLVDEARELAAVNTIKLEGERLIGYNTDARGFVTSLKLGAGADPNGKRVLLLGAGGAAKAVAVSLVHEGVAELIIANRSLPRAEKLVQRLRAQAAGTEIYPVSLQAGELKGYVQQADIIINATPVGLKPQDEPLIDTGLLRRGQLIYDLVYNPPQTKLLAQARANGARTINGMEMLIYQGALTFEIWTGRKAPIEVMRAAVTNP
jgi:shikimate dehydrogenase